MLDPVSPRKELRGGVRREMAVRASMSWEGRSVCWGSMVAWDGEDRGFVVELPLVVIWSLFDDVNGGLEVVVAVPAVTISKWK
jgi:hypothetical protein